MESMTTKTVLTAALLGMAGLLTHSKGNSNVL